MVLDLVVICTTLTTSVCEYWSGPIYAFSLWVCVTHACVWPLPADIAPHNVHRNCFGNDCNGHGTTKSWLAFQRGRAWWTLSEIFACIYVPGFRVFAWPLTLEIAFGHFLRKCTQNSGNSMRWCLVLSFWAKPSRPKHAIVPLFWAAFGVKCRPKTSPWHLRLLIGAKVSCFPQFHGEKQRSRDVVR